MINMKFSYMYIVIFSLIIIMVTSCSNRDGRENINKNKKTGDLVVNALYIYKETYGVFPKTLKDLLPNYLQEIPKTQGGQDFFYITDSFDGFIISFKVESRLGCGYTDKLKDWDCSYGD